MSKLSGVGALCLVGSTVLLTALGCKDDKAGGGGTLPADQLSAQYAAVFCHKLFTCCDATELASSPATMVDEATCRTAVVASLAADTANYQASIAAGKTLYHGDRAQHCLDQVTALACDRWGGDDELHELPDCLTFYEGTIAPGAACERSEQCRGGHCESSVCVADAKMGEACDIGSCVLELVCIYNADGTAGTCGLPHPDGANCFYSDECESHVCGPGAGGPHVCIPPTICNGV